MDELPAQDHAVRFDRQLQLAARIAAFAGRAPHDGVDGVAIPAIAPPVDVVDNRIAAARRLALPATSGILLARAHAVPAPGMRRVGDLSRYAVPFRPQGARVVGLGLRRIGDRPYGRFENRGDSHEPIERATALPAQCEHFAGIHDALGIDAFLESFERT